MKSIEHKEYELKKHSSLIQMKNVITATQRKMFNSLLYLSARMLRFNPDLQVFQIKLSELRLISGLNEFTNKKYLKQQLSELQEISVQYNLLNKDKEIWMQFSLLSQVKIEFGGEYCEVAFPPAIRDTLQHPEIYSLLNLGIINHLSGKYSVAMYELLADYKKINRLRVEVPLLKNLLNVPEDKYGNFAKFKERVIDFSIEEINDKTDLEVSIEYERKGRQYTAVCFNIATKSNKIKTATYALLKNYGLTDTAISKYSNLLPSNKIIECIEMLNKSKSVRNRVAYLTKLLENTIVVEDGVKLPQADRTNSIKSNKDGVKLPQAKQNNIQLDPFIYSEDSEFKEYYQNKTNSILSEITEDIIDEYLFSISNFLILHLQQKNIIDQNKVLINREELIRFNSFVGWVQNKYMDINIEYKNYELLKAKNNDNN